MLKSMLKTTVLAAIVLAGWLAPAKAREFRLFDLAGQKVLSGTAALERLRGVRFILVGEHHDRADHHRAQLEVIKALQQSGRKVAVGLEMFRRDSQADLDRWVAGETSEDRFKPIYLDNWNFGWDLYRPIFDYARREKIPMIGLNVSRNLTAQVAYHGFESLNSDQRGSLEGITCDVTAEYRDFVRRAYGAHGHGQMDFGRFCEAQLVWDTAMALNAIDYLQQHPDTVLVILAGSGHARKLGIPAQLAKRTTWPVVVVLPETAGIFDPEHTSVQDADFLILRVRAKSLE
jgi:uncharacterized iron-regulated protein